MTATMTIGALWPFEQCGTTPFERAIVEAKTAAARECALLAAYRHVAGRCADHLWLIMSSGEVLGITQDVDSNVAIEMVTDELVASFFKHHAKLSLDGSSYVVPVTARPAIECAFHHRWKQLGSRAAPEGHA